MASRLYGTTRCLQVQMVLETLDDPLPEPVE
jgi:hypothetical protein